MKNYHPRLTGYEELQRTCYPGRGKDYVREPLNWALSTNPRGAYGEGPRRSPLRLEPGDAPYLGQMPVPCWSTKEDVGLHLSTNSQYKPFGM